MCSTSMLLHVNGHIRGPGLLLQCLRGCLDDRGPQGFCGGPVVQGGAHRDWGVEGQPIHAGVGCTNGVIE